MNKDRFWGGFLFAMMILVFLVAVGKIIEAKANTAALNARCKEKGGVFIVGVEKDDFCIKPDSVITIDRR